MAVQDDLVDVKQLVGGESPAEQPELLRIVGQLPKEEEEEEENQIPDL
jgi:hypothetical protein